MPFQEVILTDVKTTDPSENSAGIIFPRVDFSLYLWRKPGFYLSNVVLPIAILTLLSPLSCAIESDGSSLGTADRLGITLTLMLTAVAYKFVVASSLPQVSYQTLLDSYVLVCFGFMCINAAENACIAIFMYEYGATKSDENYFILAYYLTLLAAHLYFLLTCTSIARNIRESSRCELTRERVERQTYAKLPVQSISDVERKEIVNAVLQQQGISPHFNRFVDVYNRVQGYPVDSRKVSSELPSNLQVPNYDKIIMKIAESRKSSNFQI